MKPHLTLKCVIIIAIALGSTLNANANAQARDTTVYFLKKSGQYSNKLVSTVDSADFIRMIAPFKLSDETVDVNEFYTGGKLKFAGTAIPSSVRLATGNLQLTGTCISFFPNGKRRSIATYKENQKQGTEYYYYPDGKPHQIVRYKNISGSIYTTAYLETFFDKIGKETCTNGKGIVYDYDDDFKSILRFGPVKNGTMNGEWKGYVTGSDSARYTLMYQDDAYLSGIGYDTLGKAFPFKVISVEARPKEGRLAFIEHFKKLTRQTYKGPKAVVDTAMISFTINEDGRLTNLEALNAIPDEALSALKDALSKCANWFPAAVYGIPLKAVEGLSLNH